MSTKDIDKWYNKNNDFGATHLFNMCKPESYLPAYADRPSMAKFLSTFSPKLRFLAGACHEICITHGRRVLVFTDWPVTQWNTELYLINLGFNVLSVRASHKAVDREKVISAFKDPRHPVQILITSMRISATAINLQTTCSDVIFVDVPSNANTAQQAAGRVLRIGQERTCRFWILTMDHTYDQCIQANAANKMISIIAGGGDMRAAEEAVFEAPAGEQSEEINSAIRLGSLTEECASLYTR